LPSRQTKLFVAKRLQNSPDVRNLKINSPLWQLGLPDGRYFTGLAGILLLI